MSSTSSSSRSRMWLKGAILLLLHCAAAAAADPGCSKPCGASNVCWKGSCVPNKCAKVLCPAAATPKQPTCNPLTGQCLTTTKKTTTTSTTTKPPAVTAAAVPKPAQDGTPCGSGSVTWKGVCVADKCQGKLCPVMSLALCTTIAPGGTSGECNPTTGNCDLGPVVPVPDGTDCGLGTCKAGKCVPNPGMPAMMPMLP